MTTVVRQGSEEGEAGVTLGRRGGLLAEGDGWGPASRAELTRGGRLSRLGQSRLREDDDVPAGLAAAAVEAEKLG